MTAPVLRKLARAIQDGPNRQALELRSTTVTSVAPGASLDGAAALTFDDRGQNVQAPYCAAYATPAVGDHVLVLFIDGAPIIIDRVIGLPVF